MSKEKVAKQMFLVVLGQVILGIGVSFIIFADLGIDAFGVFHSGVANTFNISFGAAMFYESLLALVVIFFVDKKYINFATVVSLFLVGFTADLAGLALNSIMPDNLGFILNLIIVFVGTFILSVGLNFYVLAGLGVGALDAVAEIITDKSRFEYKVVKMGNDLFFLGIGFLLGGKVGIATILTAFTMGPTIQFVRERVSQPIKNWIS
ncbi:MAG TPA: hypothetical protein VFC83_04120 [Erysipelotrichaceae bacterium]|nr:hypothetical protein [Erysipelotrichaceae bacterium]